jgi:exopolysaccharide biosynthesis polyprenyl glycosylphosphotransferase
VIALRRKLLLPFFKLYDLLVMGISFGMAAGLTYEETGAISLEDFFSMRVKVKNFILFSGMVLLWHLIFSSFGLYDSRRLASRREEAFNILQACSLASALLIPAAMIVRIDMATPMFILFFWIASCINATLARYLLRSFLKRIRLRGRNLRHILIVGTNARAIHFAQMIESQKEIGYRILGFIDKEWEGIKDFKRNGYKLVTDFSGFPAYLRNNVVDEVMIALPLKSQYQQASRVVATCQEQGILARHLSDVFNTKWDCLPEVFEGEPVISHYTRVFDPTALLVKRTLDIGASLLALIALAPLFMVVALRIKRDSPGPVFFVQERMGINKRRFQLFKFRTMITGAEQKMADLEQLNEMSGPVFKIQNDPRITRIGKLLRSTSIDELPQLINVLKGDMSLVGPRPLPVRDYNGFDQDWHRRRFNVRPGITCLWQVNGRNTIHFDRWMELDMEYIDHWSLFLDLKILLKTIPAVFKRSGAA